MRQNRKQNNSDRLFKIYVRIPEDKIVHLLKKGVYSLVDIFGLPLTKHLQRRIDLKIERVARLNKRSIKSIIEKNSSISSLYYDYEVGPLFEAGLTPKPEPLPTKEEEMAETVYIVSLAMLDPNPNQKTKEVFYDYIEYASETAWEVPARSRYERVEEAVDLILLGQWLRLFPDAEIAFYVTCTLLNLPGEVAFKALQKFNH